MTQLAHFCRRSPIRQKGVHVESGLSLLAMGQRIFESDSRNRPGVIVRKPDRAVADTQRVSSGSGPMTAERYGGRINRRKRNLRHRSPNHSRAETDITAMPRRTQPDGLGSIASCIDTRERPVALVEGPYRVAIGSKESRIGTRGHGCESRAVDGINDRHFCAGRPSYPDMAAIVRGIEGTGRYPDYLSDDPRIRRSGLESQPCPRQPRHYPRSPLLRLQLLRRRA